MKYSGTKIIRKYSAKVTNIVEYSLNVRKMQWIVLSIWTIHKSFDLTDAMSSGRASSARKIWVTTPFKLSESTGNALLAKFTVVIC